MWCFMFQIESRPKWQASNNNNNNNNEQEMNKKWNEMNEKIWKSIEGIIFLFLFLFFINEIENDFSLALELIGLSTLSL